jgi:hypothetical protein
VAVFQAFLKGRSSCGSLDLLALGPGSGPVFDRSDGLSNPQRRPIQGCRELDNGSCTHSPLYRRSFRFPFISLVSVGPDGRIFE